MIAALILPLLFGELPVSVLDSLLDASSRPRGGTASAAVLRFRDDSLLWSHDSWRRMLPASTQKVLTGSALRSLIGGSRTFSTSIFRTGPIEDSVLRGDLVLEGSGDPDFARGDDSLALEAMLRTVRRQGIRHVAGSFVVRDPLLRAADGLWPGNWDWDNSLTDCDGAPSTGISMAGNCPGDSSLARPHRYALERFHAAAFRARIGVDGPDRIELGTPGNSADTLVALHESRPFDSLLAQALAKSSNHDMETFGLVAGADDPISTRREGLRRVKARLRSLGLDTTRTDLVDHSGLSRKNAVSTGAMVRLLQRISRDSAMNLFPLLPGPGEGTLRNRFKRTLAPGTRLRAKTGSLDGTSALVGILVDRSGDSLAFALFYQGHAGPATAVRFAQDQIVGILAGGALVKPTAQDTTPPPPRAAKPIPLRFPIQDP